MPEFAANNTLEELLEMAAVGKYIKPPPAIIERREWSIFWSLISWVPLFETILELYKITYIL